MTYITQTETAEVTSAFNKKLRITRSGNLGSPLDITLDARPDGGALVAGIFTKEAGWDLIDAITAIVGTRPPKPTAARQFAALPIGATFKSDSSSRRRVKVSDNKYIVVGHDGVRYNGASLAGDLTQVFP